MGSSDERIRILQASNISPQASREQIYQLFSLLGKIDEIRTYPTETHPQYAVMNQKYAYILFDDDKSVEVGTHLTNTVFIDRALICIPYTSNRMPDEETALKMGGPAGPGQRQLPPNVVNQIVNQGDQQLVRIVAFVLNYYYQLFTIDPTLTSLGLPTYPGLPANTDASKVEEIRRTIYVGNISKDISIDDLIGFFNDHIGEVMYLRMAGSDTLPVRYAYIEFANQHSVSTALQNNGIEFKGKALRIQHSRVAIIKPLHKTADMAKEEVEEAMRSHQKTPLDQTVVSATSTQRLSIGLQGALAQDRPWSPPTRSRSSPSPVRRRRPSPDNVRRRSRSPPRISPPRRRRSRSRDDRSLRDQRDSKRSRSRDRRRPSRDRRRSKDRSDRSREREKEREREKDRKEKQDQQKRRRSRSKSKTRDKPKESKEKDRRREKEKRKEKDNKKEMKREDATSAMPDDDETALRERLLEKVVIVKTEKDSTAADSDDSSNSSSRHKQKVVSESFEKEKRSSSHRKKDKKRRRRTTPSSSSSVDSDY